MTTGSFTHVIDDLERGFVIFADERTQTMITLQADDDLVPPLRKAVEAGEFIGIVPESAWDANDDEVEKRGYEKGFKEGRESGLISGHEEGCHGCYNEGFEAGKRGAAAKEYEAGYNDGHRSGKDEGLAEGRDAVYKAGYGDGRTDGRAEGFNSGRAKGHTEGYAEGFNAGLSVPMAPVEKTGKPTTREETINDMLASLAKLKERRQKGGNRSGFVLATFTPNDLELVERFVRSFS